MNSPTEKDVLRLRDADRSAIERLLASFGLEIVDVPAGRPVPGSFWGDEEAGLIGDRLHARPDTPVHSVLHEACHYVCMSPQRRARLHTDAGGTRLEEEAVCVLEVLLADRVPGFGRARCLADMDAWGYNFALGSARAWFEGDSAPARRWLSERGLGEPGRLNLRADEHTREAGSRDRSRTASADAGTSPTC
ncbi:MAG: hypothetical protein R3323_08760 [Wenzhouxiangellaceae bacterium]|nr:hypothetical protein [Wenzhouxiangellaceae bacterium]